VQRAISLGRRSDRRLERTAVLPGRATPWRPPVNIAGLIEMSLRPRLA
jgi:hypothetical protein